MNMFSKGQGTLIKVTSLAIGLTVGLVLSTLLMEQFAEKVPADATGGNEQSGEISQDRISRKIENCQIVN